MADLISGKDVVVHNTGEDRYKRTLGTIHLGPTNVNQKMIADGWAWHFKKYNKDEALAKLEVQVRKARLGLWADPNALSPWEFRQRQAGNEKTEVPAPSSGTSTPTTKKYWLNTSSNIRHNEKCDSFNNTKKGRFCTSVEGKACGKCGG